MKIGIDIDDTITNTWESLIPIYAQKFNIPLEKMKTLPPYYNGVKDLISLEEYFELMSELEYAMKQVPLKENVKEILTKLKEEGNTIVFITARGKSYSDPYHMTKEYLDKFSIPYDKIIVNAWEKGNICKEEKIDLFIDDSIRNCKDVSLNGINVLMMEASYNKNNQEFIHMKNWNQIYEYIKNR